MSKKKGNYERDAVEEALDMVKAEKLLQKMHTDLKVFDCSIRLDILASLMDEVFKEVKEAVTKTEHKEIVREILKHLRETNK